MPNLTKSGVCYELSESPFKVSHGVFTYYFSSYTHMLKFKRKMVERIDWLNDSFSKRFKVKVVAPELAMLQLYMQIEKRGFHVRRLNNVYTSPSDLIVHVEWW